MQLNFVDYKLFPNPKVRTKYGTGYTEKKLEIYLFHLKIAFFLPFQYKIYYVIEGGYS